MTYLVVEAMKARTAQQWDWLPLRRVARLRRERNESSDAALLALSSEAGVKPRPDDGGRQLPSDATIADYWLVHSNDLVFNPMWAIGRGVAVSQADGAVSTAYRVYEPGPRLHPRFLHYYMRCDPIIDQYALVIRGLTTFDRSVTRDDLDGLPVPLPPLADQRAIADYLDAETARIDALIDKKRRLGNLLDERFDSLLGQCFVELGAEAQVGPIAGLCDLVLDCVNKTAETTDYETPFVMIRTSNVKKGKVDLSDVNYVSEDTFRIWTRRGRPRPGDVLLTREAPVGEVGTIQMDRPVFLGQRLMMFRAATGRSLPAYIEYALRSWPVREQMDRISEGSLHAHLRVGDCSRLRVPLVSIEDQLAVVDCLKPIEDRMDSLRVGLARLIGLLVEHRQALITAAVTGELSVPGVAA